MAELADAADSKSAGAWHLGGSTPPPGRLIRIVIPAVYGISVSRLFLRVSLFLDQGSDDWTEVQHFLVSKEAVFYDVAGSAGEGDVLKRVADSAVFAVPSWRIGFTERSAAVGAVGPGVHHRIVVASKRRALIRLTSIHRPVSTSAFWVLLRLLAGETVVASSWRTGPEPGF
jgi:hypothetical protein